VFRPTFHKARAELDNLPGHADCSCKASASLLGKGFAGDRCQGAPKGPFWQEDKAWLQGPRQQARRDPLSALASEHAFANAAGDSVESWQHLFGGAAPRMWLDASQQLVGVISLFVCLKYVLKKKKKNTTTKQIK